MKKTLPYAVSVAVIVFLIGFGCERKFDLGTLPDAAQVPVVGDTSYIEILPPWGGFESPRSIMIGNDQLLYVCDYGGNEVVMMDASGAVLARRSVPHPTAIAQNSKLDLYVCGETLAPNKRDSIGAIYRIYLVRFDTLYLSRIDTLINHSTQETTYVPVIRDTSFFYFHDLAEAPMRLIWQEPARPQRRFVGIGMLPANDYLVARTGNDNSSFVDPDSRVLLFSKDDVMITPLPDLVTRPSGGSYITDINQLTGITTFPSSRDFILTQEAANVSYGAIWMYYQLTADFDGWLPRFDPSKPDQRGVEFIRAGRFQKPTAAAIDRRRRDVFIVDAALDSVVKFDRTGRFKGESFGAAKSTTNQFPGLKNPTGIAYSNDCTLYISDTGNKLVRRFKLSTQTQCY